MAICATTMVVLAGAWLLMRATASPAAADGEGVVAEGAAPVLVQDGFMFTEGPACDAEGNVLFSDVRASRIYRWSLDGEIALFREETGRANGLFFDPDGNLVACEMGNGRVVSIDPQGELTVVADEYAGARFNQPNDVWVAPDGGVYFSDPVYGQGERTQDGEHVYYVSPDRQRVVRVISDMVRPNGLIGTTDGRTLYITDHGDGKTWRFSVAEDGTLTDRALFVEVGGDGMTIDAEGNVYIAADGVLVFSPAGEQIERIELPERPTNMTFAGSDRRTLFITARGSVFTLDMRVQGLMPPGE